MTTVSEFFIGQRVKYKAAGKIARLEGKAGKWCTATVTGIRSDTVVVLPDHRKVKGSNFFNLSAGVDPENVKPI